MIATKLMAWMIIAYGISNIVVYGSIFKIPRNIISSIATSNIPIISTIGEFIREMTSCMMCFGFHCGWFLSLTLHSPSHELFETAKNYSWFFDAAMSSGSVWIINSIIEWFEENRPK